MKELESHTRNLIYKFETNIASDQWDSSQFTLNYEYEEYRQESLVGLIRKAVPYFAFTPQEFEIFSKTKPTGFIYDAWKRVSQAKKYKKGDYGELLLFLILSFFYPTDRFVTKVKLRSSCKEQIKGFDCAHFSIDDEGKAQLWLGEAKFHNSYHNAITSVFKEIDDHCGLEYLDKELSILALNNEINKDSTIYPQIQDILDRNISLEDVDIVIPALLTYDSKTIKNNSDIKADDFVKDFEKELSRIYKLVDKKKVNIKNNFKIMIIMFPFESVKSIKDDLDMIEKAHR